jgi:hypothetical protein
VRFVVDLPELLVSTFTILDINYHEEICYQPGRALPSPSLSGVLSRGLGRNPLPRSPTNENIISTVNKIQLQYISYHHWKIV